jgi:hypothetical protein
MIVVKNYTTEHLAEIQRIHREAGLPPECMPNLENPLFFVRKVVDDNGKVALAGFLKMTAEAFVLVDHEHESPEWRWAALQKLTAVTLHEAAVKTIQDVTAWLPPDVEKSFGSRLEALGFKRSPWPSFSVRLD